MAYPNLHLQQDWSKDRRILNYTVYSINSAMMQRWSEDVLTALRNPDPDNDPRILFDLSYPNTSMSYFVLSHREMFNAGITREGKDQFLSYLDKYPQRTVKLAVVLSSTMLGALSKYVPDDYDKLNYSARIFFDREPAEDWLRVDPGEEAFSTNAITSQTLMRVMRELENHQQDIYGDRDFLRIVVKGSLEVIPLEKGRPVIVGRSGMADLDLSIFGQVARNVSRRHAQISLTNGRLSIIDLESRNGTFINELRIEAGKAVFIRRDDVIRVGNVEFSIMF